MGVDQTSLDRIRNATFPSARRGYDRHEVEKFLAHLADWLETGAGDESRSDTVKRELERVGQRTGAILAQAEESAQEIRAEAEEEAQETINSANAQAQRARAEADAYAAETRESADDYAEELRSTAEQDANATRIRTEEETRQAIESAEAKAMRIVEDGTQRREDLEAVITDLLRRRDDVLADVEELSSRLTAAVAQHRSSDGPDPFAKPDQLDPLEREDAEGDLEDGHEPTAEREAEAEPTAERAAETEPAEEEAEPGAARWPGRGLRT